MDKLTLEILKKLNEFSSLGELKVISYNAFLKELKSNISIETLYNTVKYLASNDYITLKYSDSEEFCYLALAKTRSYIESLNEKNKENKRRIIGIILNSIFCGIFAFLGAFLAIIIFVLGRIC